MKIFDTFMFCHELDMLELRLRLYYDYVDYFVLLECDHTHQNKPKPLYYSENQERFAWAEDKIVHLTHEGKFEGCANELDVEHAQRQILYNRAIILPHEDNDIMLISDIDELIGREDIEYLKANPPKVQMVFEQDFYYYNINCPRNKGWFGTMATQFSHGMPNIRDARGQRSNMAKREGGWHLSYFMNHEEIIQKLSSFAHNDYAEPPYTDKPYIEKYIRENKNFLGKDDGKKSPKPVPHYLMKELRRFPVFVGGAI